MLGNKDLLDYSMTKGGIHAFTRSLATHLIDRGIRVNAVAPGPVWTPLNPADKSAEKVAKFGGDTPMKRPGAAGRDRAGLRVSRRAVLLQLHHRRGAADHRRLFGRLTFKRMRILLTNDDGIEAAGIGVLEKIATDLTDDVWVVAPETDNSGASHSLTLAEPLRMRELNKRHYAVKGTPTDCVIMGVRFLLRDQPPDLVLSGVNRGQNLADDVTYSGTVAGAIQGTLLGIPLRRHEPRLRAGRCGPGRCASRRSGRRRCTTARRCCASCSMPAGRTAWSSTSIIRIASPAR